MLYQESRQTGTPVLYSRITGGQCCTRRADKLEPLSFTAGLREDSVVPGEQTNWNPCPLQQDYGRTVWSQESRQTGTPVLYSRITGGQCCTRRAGKLEPLSFPAGLREDSVVPGEQTNWNPCPFQQDYRRTLWSQESRPTGTPVLYSRITGGQCGPRRADKLERLSFPAGLREDSVVPGEQTNWNPCPFQQDYGRTVWSQESRQTGTPVLSSRITGGHCCTRRADKLELLSFTAGLREDSVVPGEQTN